MKLENKKCNIFIEIDRNYKIGSADNYQYDLVLNPLNYIEDYYDFKAIAIHIDCFYVEHHIAILSAWYPFYNTAILKEDKLTIMVNKSIIQIDIMTGKIIKANIVDFDMDMYEIIETKKGYLIHGEWKIVLLDFDFNLKWYFKGLDVFVAHGKPSFQLKEDENLICLYDFEDNYFEIDLDGNLIKEILAY